jgi:hypothetical protein
VAHASMFSSSLGLLRAGYAESGARDDVAATRRERLGADFMVATRAAAVGVGRVRAAGPSRVAPRATWSWIQEVGLRLNSG